MTDDPYLVTEGLCRSRGKRQVVRDVSLRCGSGVIALVGPNGAGKSTLLRLLAGLLRPSEGTIRWGPPALRRDGRPSIGYLPQDFGFYQDFSARHFLRYLAAVRGVASSDPGTLIDDAIARVNLTAQADVPLRRLSGGMLRRVGLAQAILDGPAVLILDEPAAGLDPEERLSLRLLIADLGRRALVLVSTHIIADIESVAERLVLLADGKILIHSTPSALIDAASGRVWQLPIEPAAVGAARSRGLVTSVTPNGGLVELRMVADDRPDPIASIVVATLEEAYLSALGRGASERVESDAEGR